MFKFSLSSGVLFSEYKLFADPTGPVILHMRINLVCDIVLEFSIKSIPFEPGPLLFWKAKGFLKSQPCGAKVRVANSVGGGKFAKEVSFATYWPEAQEVVLSARVRPRTKSLKFLLPRQPARSGRNPRGEDSRPQWWESQWRRAGILFGWATWSRTKLSARRQTMVVFITCQAKKILKL